MRCLSTALASACLLAPALARAESSSSAYIVFEDLPPDFPVDYLDFAFNVNEATDPCGPVNATINNQALSEAGAGTFTTRQEYTFDAAWDFACVEAPGATKEQTMSLSINSVSGVAVKDLDISVKFRQAAPMAISSIRGPASMALFGDDDPKADSDEQKLSPAKLVAELDEIDTLRARVAEIHRIIRTHERLVAESYGWVRGHVHHGPKNCDSIGCFVTSLFDKARGLAASLFHNGHGRPPHHRWRGPPRWWRHRHHRPGDGPGCGPGGPPMGPDHPPSRRPHFRHGPPGFHEPPFPPPPHHPGMPPPPPEDEDGRPAPPPPSEKTGGPVSGIADWSWPSTNRPLHGSGPDFHGRPQGHPPVYGSRRRGKNWLSLLAEFSLYSIILGVIIALVHQRCRAGRDKDEDAEGTTWWQRFQARREARKQRRAAVKRALGRLAASLRRVASGACGGADDEEKIAMLVEMQQQQQQQQPSGESPSDDSGDGDRDGDMDTTVGEEIAGLRVAADFVTDIIAAEQNRARRQQQQQQQTEMATTVPRVGSMFDRGRHQPLSSTAVLTGYSTGRPSTDSGYSRYSEALPAYQATESAPPPSANTDTNMYSLEESLSPASSLVADGLMYMPGSSAYVPGSPSSSLAGLGSADALGDTKN